MSDDNGGKGDGGNKSGTNPNEPSSGTSGQSGRNLSPKDLNRAQKFAQSIIDDAKKGTIKLADNYHGRLPTTLEQEILSNPDAVFASIRTRIESAKPSPQQKVLFQAVTDVVETFYS